jgi:RNA polymerase sigma factor (TIGR02999 family)
MTAPDERVASRTCTDPDSKEAEARLYDLIYDDLKERARRQLNKQGRFTVGTTELVNEAYLKLAAHSALGIESRVRFLCLASTAMKNILIDHARRRRSLKHGGSLRRTDLDPDEVAVETRAEQLIALEPYIERLRKIDERLALTVVRRFFGGMTEEEVAGSLDVSVKTVKRDWTKAKLFLREWLAEDDAAGSAAG